MSGAIDRLMAIMEAAFDPYWREAWTRGQVEGSLAMPGNFVLFAGPDGEPPATADAAVGFILVRNVPGEAELLLVAVDPACRRGGVGARLIERCAAAASERGAERLFLEMRADNPAGALYRRLGFEPIGRRRAYYRTVTGEPIDAITFAKSL